MPVPVIDRRVFSEDCPGLYAVLLCLSDIEVALLAELVPERSSDLWVKWTTWSEQAPEGSEPCEWLTDLTCANIVKVVYPQGCQLDEFTRQLLMHEVMKAVAPENDAEFLNVHFGVEPQYGRARNVACRGCNMRSCSHYVARPR